MLTISPLVVHDFPARHRSHLPEFSGQLIDDLTEVVQRAEDTAPTPQTSRAEGQEPNAALAKGVGRFFTIKKIAEIVDCSEPACQWDTSLVVNYSDGCDSYAERPLCRNHAHWKFAEWMVGA